MPPMRNDPGRSSSGHGPPMVASTLVADMGFQEQLDDLVRQLEEDPEMEVHLIFGEQGELKYAHRIRKYLHVRFPEATFKFVRAE